MGFFDRFTSRTVHDTTLGIFRRQHGEWRGAITLPALGAAELWLPGDAHAPSARASAVAVELLRRWPVVSGEIAAALFEHYAPYRDAADEMALPDDDEAIPRIGSPGDVWPHVHEPLVRIADDGDGAEVRLALGVAWDVEHTIGVYLRDWRVHELSGSVLRGDL